MKRIPFDPAEDIPPISFEQEHLQLAGRLGIAEDAVSDLFSRGALSQPGDELLGLYRLILQALESR